MKQALSAEQRQRMKENPEAFLPQPPTSAPLEEAVSAYELNRLKAEAEYRAIVDEQLHLTQIAPAPLNTRWTTEEKVRAYKVILRHKFKPEEYATVDRSTLNAEEWKALTELINEHQAALETLPWYQKPLGRFLIAVAVASLILLGWQWLQQPK